MAFNKTFTANFEYDNLANHSINAHNLSSENNNNNYNNASNNSRLMNHFNQIEFINN